VQRQACRLRVRGSNDVYGRFTAMSTHDDDDAAIPMMQKLLDNPFLLLFLGVLIPMVVYNLWGVIDILTVPLAK
jgi:hypothetical protein